MHFARKNMTNLFSAEVNRFRRSQSTLTKLPLQFALKLNTDSNQIKHSVSEGNNENAVDVFKNVISVLISQSCE